MSGYYSPESAEFKENLSLAQDWLGTQGTPLVSPDAQDGSGEIRPLYHILPAAQRIEEATDRLRGFVDDFYGFISEEPTVANPGDCYSDHIKRLIAALDNLDVVIGKVREIG